MTKKQLDCLQDNHAKFVRALLKLIPQEKQKKAQQLLGDIIEMELQIEAECQTFHDFDHE